MERKLSIVKRVFIAFSFLGIVTIVVLNIMFPEQIFPLAPYIDTEFADGFSFKNWRKIKVGMTQNEVRAILGQPLDTTFMPTMFNRDSRPYPIPENDEFQVNYSGDGNCSWGDFAWKSFSLNYDQNLMLVSKHAYWCYD